MLLARWRCRLAPVYVTAAQAENAMDYEPYEPVVEFWKAVVLCVLAYTVAMAVALGVGAAMSGAHPIAVAAVADLAATVAIFIFSFNFSNSSFYDPYWSVAPMPIAMYWIVSADPSEVNLLRQTFVLTLVMAWGVRLTYNWYRQWGGLEHEDWRYVDLREKSGSAYWVVSFFGIHLFPSVLVFLGCLTLWPSVGASGTELGILDGIALAVTASAIWIEATADKQLWHFLTVEQNHPGQIMDKGLWSFSRHPNYFGEIMFWWGLYLFALAADPSYWWTVIGPLGINIMFVTISVPLLDKRSLERRPHYLEHMQNVPAIAPWFSPRL